MRQKTEVFVKQEFWNYSQIIEHYGLISIPLLVPGGGFLYRLITEGVGFLSPQTRVSGGDGYRSK